MNGFEHARTIEARSMAMLRPFLLDTQRQYVYTMKGGLAKYLQEIAGDLAFNDKAGTLWFVEVKSEQKYTGNLFLETWSNRNLESKSNHAERGMNMGWLYKLRSDLLFYHFLDRDCLFIIDMFALKRWAFCSGRLYDFPERRQNKYDQLNDTWGRVVPIVTLKAELEPKPIVVSVQQLRLSFIGEETDRT